jgi:hypothetical protein
LTYSIPFDRQYRKSDGGGCKNDRKQITEHGEGEHHEDNVDI